MDIFLSYSWRCSSLADQLERYIEQEPSFSVQRDIRAIRTAGRIRHFMDSIRNAFCIVLLLNDSYLHSENCVYELVTFSKERNYSSRLIPVVIQGTDIFSQRGILEILQFWERERRWRVLPFEPRELLHVLETIRDMRCVIYDESEPFLSQDCGKTVVDYLIQQVFSREVRPNTVERRQIPLVEEPLLCIDFGTTYTLASAIDLYGEPHLVPDCCGQVSFQSILELRPDGSYAVGNIVASAHSSDRSYVVRALKRTILSVKRCEYGPYRFSVPLLLAMIFHSVKRNAEEFFGRRFHRALLSIPVDFHQKELKILVSAAEMAGLQVERAIQESSTGALLVGSHVEKLGHNDAEEYLTIDLGGGTLDISAATMEDGICEVLWTIGDRLLGSMDYDRMFCEYAISRLQKEHRLATIYPESRLYEMIRKQAEQLKFTLTDYKEGTFSLEFPNDMGNIEVCNWRISRRQYAKITKTLTDRLVMHLRNTKKQVNDYFYPDAIYLTGQGSKLFSVKQAIQNVYPGLPIVECFQESAVCHGLAEQSGILAGTRRNLLLLDVFHHDIDIKCEKYAKRGSLASPITGKIFIGARNEEFHRLIGGTDGVQGYGERPIPFSMTFELQFSGETQKKGGNIELYNAYPDSNVRTKFFAKALSPQETANIRYMILRCDANGELTVDLYTVEEYKTQFI